MEAVLDFFLWAVSRIPLSLLRRTGAFFGGVAYAVAPKYRRKILNNIHRVGLPESVARESSRHTGMLAAETGWLWGRSNEDIARVVTFEPGVVEAFSSVLDAGKSVILMTPHVGGFEAIPVAVFEAILKERGKVLSILYREHSSLCQTQPYAPRDGSGTG